MNETDNLSTSRATASPSTTWSEFWFLEPETTNRLRVIRVGFAVLSIWYFVSHFADIGLWFAADGILSTERLGRFLEAADLLSETQWRLSPLYWISSTPMLRGFLIVGMLFALATLFQRIGRVASIGLWLCAIWLANRSVLIDNAQELVLSFGLLYLAIAAPRNESHWTKSVAIRLIQVHVTMLIAITALTMLSSDIWWDGTGSISLAAPVERRLFDLTEWLSSPLRHEPLTHLIVFTAIAAPIGLWIRRTRLIAYGALNAWCLVLAMLSSQWLYFAGIALLSQSFAPQTWFPWNWARDAEQSA